MPSQSKPGKALSQKNYDGHPRSYHRNWTYTPKAGGKFAGDGKQLMGDYITAEELWACTSCNACVEACPVDIDPLSIIMDMGQYLVMKESAASTELNAMMSNIENNGAPWPFNNQDRLEWAKNH